MKFFNRKKRWILAGIYILGIFLVNPFLPGLIRLASSLWTRPKISRFVLVMELVIVLFLLCLSLFLLIKKQKKSVLLIISLSGIFLLSLVLYQFLPNPYEFTHLPEYAILSMLLVRAYNNGKITNQVKGKWGSLIGVKNYYFFSIMITSAVGTGDEIYQHFLPNRYFTWYDIFLNLLGGILGLLVYWGITK